MSVPPSVRRLGESSRPRLGGRERFGFLGSDESDLDEVQRADEALGDAEATRAHDGVAEPDRPAMLEQDERGGGIVRNLRQDVPRFFLREDVDAIGGGLRARDRAGLHALFPGRSESQERSDDGPELLRLLLRELTSLQGGDLSVRVLVDHERVDHANRVITPQPLELVDDLALEIGLVEPQGDQLYRSDRHLTPPSIINSHHRCAFCSAPEKNSSAVFVFVCCSPARSTPTLVRKPLASAATWNASDGWALVD